MNLRVVNVRFRKLMAWALLAALTPLTGVPVSGAEMPLADRVVVDKSDRTLLLMRGDQVLKRARVALGLSPYGHKLEEGDSRTPEGRYLLTKRNPDSNYFLSILVSYPNEKDRARAANRGVSPGGQIMIHGLPNEPSRSEEYYRLADWTDGCIAVSNSDMVDIWLMTTPNTPIEIHP